MHRSRGGGMLQRRSRLRREIHRQPVEKYDDDARRMPAEMQERGKSCEKTYSELV